MTATAGDNDLDVSEAAALRYAVQRLSRRLKRQAQYGLTTSQISALTTIERQGDLSMARLRELEQSSKSTLTRVVAGLESEGYTLGALGGSGRRPRVCGLAHSRWPRYS